MSYSVLTMLSRMLEAMPGDGFHWLVLGMAIAVAVVLVRLHDRVARLERELRQRRGVAPESPGMPPAAVVAPSPHAPAAAAPPLTPQVPEPAPGPAYSAGDRPPPTPGDPTPPVPAVAPAPTAAPGTTATRAPFPEPDEENPVTWPGRFFEGGNWLVRGGVVVLFLGVGFLLKFAADNALLPVEARLAAVGAGAVAMLALGLRLVARRRAYALALQGGGVGLLYLTLYAAFRLHGLLPAEPAFALMAGVVAGAGWLAWRQDALALAVMGALGGFAAPLLASTGSGSHVLLFGYYAVLNAGVLGLAFVRTWRVLNLVGFTATFLASGLWGHRFYQASHFASVEPFLVLFFLMYLGIAVLFALGRGLRLRDPMDATLVFGTPLVAFGLQSRLLAGSGHGLAASALAMAGVYAVLAWQVRRRAAAPAQVLAQAFAALAVGFATIAVPLALDARWTAASWALEGAALLWVGWRQRRVAARLAGAALQVLAGAAWVWHGVGQTRWETGDWLGAVMIAVAGLASSAVLANPAHGERDGDERPLGLCLGVWGLLFWYGGNVIELLEKLSDARAPGAVLLLLAASALALEAAGARTRWALARAAALALPALLVPVALAQVFQDAHPLQGLAAAGWPAAFAAALLVLYRQDARRGAAVAAAHLATLWLAVGLGAWEMAWAFQSLLPPVQSWRRLAWLLVPAVAVACIAWRGASGRPWPFSSRGTLYLTVGAGPLACVIGGGVFALSVADPHGPWPIPYLPLLNPLDLGLVAVTGACLAWVARARRHIAPGVRNAMVVAGAGLGFLWLNGALLRTLHFWAHIPYRFGPMFHSTLAQASLSVLWACTGLVTMVAASRSASRVLWAVGAGLMGVVVAKLMLVDLASSGTIARIVSFISVGLLLMLVGYLAPVPPRSEASNV